MITQNQDADIEEGPIGFDFLYSRHRDSVGDWGYDGRHVVEFKHLYLCGTIYANLIRELSIYCVSLNYEILFENIINLKGSI